MKNPVSVIRDTKKKDLVWRVCVCVCLCACVAVLEGVKAYISTRFFVCACVFLLVCDEYE